VSQSAGALHSTYESAVTAYRAKQWVDAERLALMALDDEAVRGDALLVAAKSSAQQGHWKESLDYARSAEELGSPTAVVLQAWAAYNLGEYAAALGLADRAIAGRDEALYDAWHVKGRAAFAVGDPKQAQQAIVRAIKIAPPGRLEDWYWLASAFCTRHARVVICLQAFLAVAVVVAVQTQIFAVGGVLAVVAVAWFATFAVFLRGSHKFFAIGYAVLAAYIAVFYALGLAGMTR